MKIMTHIKNYLKSIFAAVAIVVQMASVAEDITWTAVTNQLNDIDPRLQLGVYIQNVTSNTISESVVGIVEEYVSPLIDTAIETSTNYTDYAVIKLAETNSVLSGGPYQHELPYLTNAIPYSVIIDAPQMESDKITDGTNTIDASGNVFCVQYLVGDLYFSASRDFDDKEYTSFYDFRYVILSNQTFYMFRDDYGRMESYNMRPMSGHDGWYEDSASYGDFYFKPNFTSTPISYYTTVITNCIGKLALTNDIPPTVMVVAPSTNATSGTAADAKAVGNALWSGFTEWECISGMPTGAHAGTPYIAEGYDSIWACDFYNSDDRLVVTLLVQEDENATTLVFTGSIVSPSEETVTFTRHLITPTKTSQLQNNGTNGVPFITASELEKKRDVTDLSIRTVPTDSNGAKFMVNGVLSKGYDGSMTVWSAPDGTSPYWNIFIDGDPPTYYIEAGTSSEHFTISESNGYAADVTVAGVDYHIVGISSNSIATTDMIPDMASVTGLVDYAISEFGRTNLVYQITDGTNTIDAAGCVWREVGVGTGVWMLYSDGMHEWDDVQYYQDNTWIAVCDGYNAYADGGEDATSLDFLCYDNGARATATQTVEYVNKFVGRLALTNNIPEVPSNCILTNDQGTATIIGSLSVGERNNITVTDVGTKFPNVVIGDSNVSTGIFSFAWGVDSISDNYLSMALGQYAYATNEGSFVWNRCYNGHYGSHGLNSFNINPANGLEGFWVGEKNLSDHIDEIASKYENGSRITDGTNTINASGEVYKKIGIGDGWILVSGLDIGGNPVWRTEELGESVSGWYAYGLEFGFQLISTEYDAIEITGVVVFARYEPDEPRPTIITTTNTWVRVNTAEKFLGKVAMTNDAVAVVAPSTNAITGTAADARDTGIAIYTGFTDWRFSDGLRHVVLGPEDSGSGWWYSINEAGYYITSGSFPTKEKALCATNLYFGNGLFATRRLITPTRTSQLENDSGFITSADLPYRLVTPGKWEFSGSGVLGGESIDEWYNSGTGEWSYQVVRNGSGLLQVLVFSSDQTILNFTELNIVATRPSLPGHLFDRAVNRVIVSQTTELTIPEANVGRVRDFYVYMTVSGGTQRVSFSPSVQYVGGRVNPDRTYSPATYFLHFMEITNGLFNVVDDLGTSGIVLGEKATGTIGVYSVTAGRGCLASGWYSQASGYFVEAKNSNEFSFGRYNNSHRNDGEFGTPSNTLWSVGFGIGASTRMNAIETMQDGKTFVYGVGGYDGTNPTQSGVNDIASVVNRFPFTNSIASADALLVQPNTTTITSWDTHDDLDVSIGGTTSSVPRECRLVVVATISFNITLDTTKFYNVESPLLINRGTTNVFSFTEFMPDKFIVTKQTIGGSGN